MIGFLMKILQLLSVEILYCQLNYWATFLIVTEQENLPLPLFFDWNN